MNMHQHAKSTVFQEQRGQGLDEGTTKKMLRWTNTCCNAPRSRRIENSSSFATPPLLGISDFFESLLFRHWKKPNNSPLTSNDPIRRSSWFKQLETTCRFVLVWLVAPWRSLEASGLANAASTRRRAQEDEGVIHLVKQDKNGNPTLFDFTAVR